jgi:predicted Rossmann-fold nucleotide-binding protein
MEKRVIAIIGTREPSEAQKETLVRVLQQLNPKSDRIISGCADGVDALALRLAQERGFETIGMLPWSSYNTAVQAHCSHVHVITDFHRDIVDAAHHSVLDNHPAPQRLTQGAMKLHMRNYGIIRWADHVYALPSNKLGGGGTGQGIRLAQALKKQITVIDVNGLLK